MNMYVWISGVTSIFFSASMTRSIMIDFEDGDSGFWLIFLLFWFLVFFAIGSLVFAYQSLSKPGISHSARTLVLKRHAAGITIFIITNSYMMVLVFYILFGIPVPTT